MHGIDILGVRQQLFCVLHHGLHQLHPRLLDIFNLCADEKANEEISHSEVNQFRVKML